MSNRGSAQRSRGGGGSARIEPYGTPRTSVSRRHNTSIVSTADSTRRLLFFDESPTPNRDSQETIGRSQLHVGENENNLPSGRRYFEEFDMDEEESFGVIPNSQMSVDRVNRRQISNAHAVHHLTSSPVASAPVDVPSDEANACTSTLEEDLRRNYDSSKFSGLFPQSRNSVWALLNRSCRLSFARYLTIKEDKFAAMIDTAAGFTVEKDSNEFSVVWGRMLQWRKNWLKEFNLHAKELWTSIVKRPECAHYITLEESQLRSVYASHWSYESWFMLTTGSTSAFVDWRATLLVPGAEHLYKSLFVYTLVYTHQLKLNKLDRESCNKRLLLLADDASFKHFTMEKLVLAPVKPCHRTRVTRKPQQAVTDLTVLDPLFVPFGDPPAAVDPTIDPALTSTVAPVPPPAGTPLP
ncbi:hypothetical protein DFP73DRAFT_598417 [Morchella snyderi]|nr:hypothetical protein DFP73DRAFT_598417 [Morchella snyderi]